MKTNMLAKRIFAVFAAIAILMGAFPFSALAQPAGAEMPTPQELEYRRGLEDRAEKVSTLALSPLSEGEGPVDAVRYAFDVLDRGDEDVNEVMALVLDQLGVEHMEVESTAARRSWSLVKLDGSWYHLDVENELLLASDAEVALSIDEQAAEEEAELPAVWTVIADPEEKDIPELPKADEAYLFEDEEQADQTLPELIEAPAVEEEGQEEDVVVEEEPVLDEADDQEAPAQATDDEAPEAPAQTADEAPEAPAQTADDEALIPPVQLDGEPAEEDFEPVLTPAASPSGNPASYPANALGFYQWLGDTKAVALFSEKKPVKFGSANPTDYVQNYTNIGAEDDATSLVNMKRAIELIAEGNQLRTTDNNFPGRAALKITSYHMAIAQLHCNWETQEFAHVSAYNVGENLSVTPQNPYTGWYTTERRVWEYKQTHPSASNSEIASALNLSLGFIQTGHYTNIVNSSYALTGLAATQSELSLYPAKYGYYTYTQVFDWSSSSAGTAYTYDEYYRLFMQFYNAHIKTISSSTVTVSSISSYTYDGNAKTPTPTVKYGSTTLVKDTDYTLSYSNNTNVGTATVTITGKGKYTGSMTKTFTINRASVSGATVTLSPSSYTYDGTAKKPTATVKVGSRTLTNGTDYTLSYSNNTNAGTATVTITGKGNYYGSASKTFTISTASIYSATVTNVVSRTYTGSAQAQSPTVKVGSRTLTNGTDYTLSYSNNTNAGTATVTITGKGNYYGSVSKSFTISSVSISGATVTLSQSSYTYDGTAKKPTVTVKVGGRTLTSGTDYTVSYTNNVNAGTATVIITGKGNYTGSVSKTFTITKAGPSLTPISSCGVTIMNPTYDGTAKTPNLTIWDGSTTLVKDTDYTLSFSNNTNAGTATVTITGKGKYTGTRQITFAINPASISGATVTLSQSSYTYDGTAKKPTVTVKVGGRTLTSGTDYTVSYTNNVNAGTATVIITGKGNYTGSVSKTFTINRAADPVSQGEAPIYRLYNWRTSEHLYTSSRTEYDTLPVRTKGDWVQEGIAWYAPDKSRTPVYRLYNPRSGDHHYTTSAAERDMLVANHGWKSEGTAFYSDDAKRVSILRVYNGRLKRGQHHYTTSASERDSLVANHGWRNEGTGFYGIRVGKTESFRMVPAGTYTGYDPDNDVKLSLTIYSDGSFEMNNIHDPNGYAALEYFDGTVVMKAEYRPVRLPGPTNWSVRPAGPYDFYLKGEAMDFYGQPISVNYYADFRYDPTTDGGCIWVQGMFGTFDHEYKMVRS